MLYANIIRCMTIKYAHFTEFSEKVYIDNNITKSEQRRIVSLVNQAKDRIIQKTGSIVSEPVIIITDSSTAIQDFGANTHGVTFILPWEQYVVIGTKGQEIDIIAHELLHAEIVERLGYLNRQLKLPVWLDEGIAMQVDYRQKYDINLSSISQQEIDNVKSLGVNEFFSRGEVLKHYQISKALVTQLMIESNETNPLSLIDQIEEADNL
jgi:hypothetical protein